MEEKKRLYLIDAYSLIFRAYYAFISRPMRNSKGLNTSAIFGFVNALEDLLNNEKPSHIAVAFDPPGPNFRHDIFDEYKANRAKTPDDIKLSVPYIKQIIEAYNIPIIECEGYEADDVIGTLSRIACDKGYDVYMVTPDKDYAQLVNECVFMYKPRKAGKDIEILDPAKVCQQFEVETPSQVIDILGLWGDSSDNIPGAPGVGEKTAKKLIKEYGSVENLLKNTDKLKGKLRENLENHSEQILKSKELVKIITSVPISFSIEELSIKEKEREKLYDLFNELEFNMFSKKILGKEVPASPKEVQGKLFDFDDNKEASLEPLSSKKGFEKSEVDYRLIQDKKALNELVNNLMNSKEFCYDTETTGLDVFNDKLLGLAFSLNEKEAYYISLHEGSGLQYTDLDQLRPVFQDPDKLKIGQNLKFDNQVLYAHGIETKGPYFDTMIAHYLLNHDAKHNLGAISEEILNYSMISIESLIGKKGKKQLNLSDIAVDKTVDYACEDADITYRLYNILKDKLTDEGLFSLFHEIEMPLMEVLTDMELTGVNVDKDVLSELEYKFKEELSKVSANIYELAGQEFNISSPKQLGLILFEKLKISANTRMTKTKQYSTSEEVLQKLKDKHPIIDLVLEYRSLSKLLSTYVLALPKLIEKKTDRVHSSFNQTIAATGRLSSISPNLQNIPIREARGQEIRKAFVPKNDQFVILSSDYSQIELRLMAHMSRDEHMVKAFAKGADIHRSTAAKIFKVKEEDVTREMRSKAKTANFGIIYGISAYGLSQRLNIPRSEASDLINNYFISFPKVREYIDESIELAKKQGFVSTIYGRKRYLPDILSSNSITRGVAERNAINSPIQGSAADIIKIAMINIRKMMDEFEQSKMVLQVHDELIFEVYKPELDEVMAMVKEQMENVISLSVPLVVDSGVGSNWLSAH